jgi:Na+-transporting NADH:ubiquinone oxidoreductase subunit A
MRYRLTEGRVHLCLAADAPQSVAASTTAPNVIVHHFAGPHPAGNTSVHIHHIAPLRPGEVLWTIRAVDVVQIGRCSPTARFRRTVYGVGWARCAAGARQHYGCESAPLAALLDGRLEPGDSVSLRVTPWRVWRATPRPRWAFRFKLYRAAEAELAFFMGWAGPGLNIYSRCARFFRAGSVGPALAAGHEPPWQPRARWSDRLVRSVRAAHIMTDFLLGAVLAHDTDEAASWGFLKRRRRIRAVFFVCPSKRCHGIIRRGLEKLRKRACEVEFRFTIHEKIKPLFEKGAKLAWLYRCTRHLTRLLLHRRM